MSQWPIAELPLVSLGFCCQGDAKEMISSLTQTPIKDLGLVDLFAVQVHVFPRIPNKWGG